MPVLVTLATVTTIILLMSRSGQSAILFFDYDQLRKRIRNSVTDPERRRAALGFVDALEKDAQAYVESAFESLDELLRGLREYEADLEEIDRTLIKQMTAKREAFLTKMIDLRFELRDVLPREEWDEVFDLETDGE